MAPVPRSPDASPNEPRPICKVKRSEETGQTSRWNHSQHQSTTSYDIIEGSLEVKLPTIWTDEKQSRAEAERRERLEERRVEEKE